MAGLGNPMAPPTMTPQAGQPQGDVVSEAGTAEQPNVTPEEQAMYDQFVGNAEQIIFPDGEDGQPTASPMILAQLRGEFDPEAMEAFAAAEPPLAQSPTDSLAGTAVMLVLVLENSMAASGMQIDPDTLDTVIFHAGAEILQGLGEVAEAADIHAYTEEELEAALYRALDLYRISSGRIDQDALKQQFGQIVEADKAGTLGQLLPGIEQRMQPGDQGAQGGQPPAAA